MPGTKWWMWRPPSSTAPNRHHPARIPWVDRRTKASEPRNPDSRLNSTVSCRGVARKPSIATDTVSCVAWPVETIATSAASRTPEGLAISGSASTAWTRRRARRSSSPTTTVPAVAAAAAASPNVTRSNSLCFCLRVLGQGIVLEADEVRRLDAPGNAAEVDHQRCLGDHPLVVYLGVGGDDADHVAGLDPLVERDRRSEEHTSELQS